MFTPEKLQLEIGKYLKDNSLELCEDICAVFERFATAHIARVNAIASFINKYYPYHDSDKFESPFYYLLQYEHSGVKLKDIVKDIDEVNELAGQATWQHIEIKPHHPEFWDKSLNADTKFDRNVPLKNVDATEMPTDALCEYVCDCMAMSVQLQKDPKKVFDWFKDNISDTKGKRWIMTVEQITFIHALASSIIKILSSESRKVYFDVDGVLRDIVKHFGTPDDDWGVLVDGKSIYDTITEDFSCLANMPPTDFVPVVQKFSNSPCILSTQIEPEAQKYTDEWLSKYFDKFEATYVGEGSSKEKHALLNENDRIFDDHPKFPSSNRLIILGHGYNENKHGFRVNTPNELEAVLDVLKKW